MPCLARLDSKPRARLDASFADFRSVQLEIMFVFGQQLLGIGLVHALSDGGIFLFRSLFHHGPDESAQKAKVNGQGFGVEIAAVTRVGVIGIDINA